MHRLVSGSGSRAVRRRGARPDVQDQRHVFARGRHQQVLARGDIGARKKSRCAASGKCQARRCRDDTPWPLRRLRSKHLAEEVGAVCDFAQPDAIGLVDRRGATEDGVRGDSRLRQCDGGIAVQHGVEAFLADVRAGRCAEHLAVPADRRVTHSSHQAVPTFRDSWSWNCSRSSHTIERVGQRNMASGLGSPPDE